MDGVRTNCFVYWIIFTVNFSMMSEGMFLGWSSPSMVKLRAPESPIKITADQSSWITSLIGIGKMSSALFASTIVDKIGRKKSLLLTTVTTSVAWIIIGVAKSPEELYAARIIAGLGFGINSVVGTMYLAEVTPARIRGMAYGLFLPSIITGECAMFIMGPRLPIHTVAWISLAVPLLSLCMVILLPESPYYLVMRGKHKEAENSLRRLRGTAEAAEELMTIRTTVEMNAQNKGGFRDLFSKRSNLKALGISVGVLTLQQSSGLMVIVFYSHSIFNKVNDHLWTDINLVPLMLRLGVSFLSATVVDRTGKKPLFILSTVGSAVFTTIIALFFTLKSSGYDVQPYSWITVGALFAYATTLSIGLAPLSNVTASELFALNVKAVGNGVFRLTESFYQFLVAKLYQIVSDNFGMQYSFWAFTLCLLFGVLFVIFMIPETKGKTLEEIQDDLQNKTTESLKMVPLITKNAQANNVQIVVQQTN